MFMLSYLQLCSLLIGGILVILAASTRDKIKEYLVERNFMRLFGLGLVGALTASGQQSLWYEKLVVEAKINPGEYDRLKAQIRMLERNNERLEYRLSEERERPVNVYVRSGFLDLIGMKVENFGEPEPLPQKMCLVSDRPFFELAPWPYCSPPRHSPWCGFGCRCTE